MSGRRARAKRKNISNISGPSDSFNISKSVDGQPALSARPDYTAEHTYIIVPEYGEGHPLAGIKLNPLGNLGEYEITYVLAIPGINNSCEDVNFDEILLNGDSLIYVDKSKGQLMYQIFEHKDAPKPVHEIEVGLNNQGRMRYLRFKITAISFNEAKQKSHNLIMPILSRWSYQHNIGITTSAIEIKELATAVAWYTLSVVGAVKKFSDQEGASSEDGRILLAAYREGMSTSEPLYKALCMFRVIAGCYILRNRRKSETTSKGETFIDPGEKIDLSAIDIISPRSRMFVERQLKQYEGKKFTFLRDQFKKDIRHAIAHIDPDGNPLAADKYQDVSKVTTAIPAMHYMARALLAEELNFHA